jgi:hypothetical protein
LLLTTGELERIATAEGGISWQSDASEEIGDALFGRRGRRAMNSQDLCRLSTDPVPGIEAARRVLGDVRYARATRMPYTSLRQRENITEGTEGDRPGGDARTRACVAKERECDARLTATALPYESEAFSIVEVKGNVLDDGLAARGLHGETVDCE